MIDFFRALYNDTAGFVPVVTYPRAERESGKPFKDWKLNQYKWFSWPREAEQMVKYCRRRREEDVYVTTGLCATRDNHKESMMPMRVIHCDADEAKPKGFALAPSIVVTTSPGHTQLYWLLKDAIPATKAERLAKRVTYSRRSHGSDYGWAANKLMRVPGTVNTKPMYSRPTVTMTDSGRVYSVKEMRKAFPFVPTVAGARLRQSESLNAAMPPVNSMPELSDVLGKIDSNPEIERLIYDEASPTDWNPDGSRYKVLWKLACSLFRQGLTPEEVFIVCYRSRSNKYLQDGRSDTELWRDVLKARVDVESRITFVRGSDDDNDTDSDQVFRAATANPRISLLTDAERELIRPTFIDTYTKWAATKTHADHQYHRANAMTILSTVMAEYGYANPVHGAMGLEMWFMVLGVTTRSFKTTAAKLMVRFLRSMDEPGDDRPYMIANNTTPEALTHTLSKRGPDRSNLFHRDEAHALVGDSQGGKGYMAGFIPLLTELYDGRVPARDRITQESTPGGETSLGISLLGVPGEMTNVLTRDDFATGFLARFVFVLGVPAPDTPETRWIAQADPNHAKDEDPEFNRLVMAIKHVRGEWIKKWNTHGGKLPITVEEDAWVRWNKASGDLVDAAKKANDPEAVIPTATRLGVAIHKLACVLAMTENHDTVDMRFMVTAIQYAEDWFDSLLAMSAMVHQNVFARSVSELIDIIGDKKMKWDDIYSHFTNIPHRQFQELVDSAVASGRLKQVKYNNNWFLENTHKPNQPNGY